MCVMYDDSNTDHRRCLKRCLLIRGDHIKKYSKGPTNCQAATALNELIFCFREVE